MLNILWQAQTKMQSLGLVIAVSVFCLSFKARAVEIDPGDYTALPSGTNAVVLYGQYAERDALYASGKKVPIDPELNSTVGILRMLHVAEINDRWTVDPQFLLPFGELRASGDIGALGKASGIGDLILATAFKYKIDAQTGEVFGFTPYLFVPTGEYHSDKALNLGENRWKAAMQVGYTRPLSQKWRVDFVGDVQFHGNNNECRAACGAASDVTRKQNALYHFQTHLRYEVSPALSLALSYGHLEGGRTEIDGASQDDRQKTDYFRLSAGYFITQTTQVLATYGRDIHQENGFREKDRINLRLFKAF